MKATLWSKLGACLAFLSLGLGLAVSPAAAPPTRPPEDEQDLVFLGESRPVLIRMYVRIDGRPVQAAWDDFMKELFAYLDVNGDGVLDKTEAERAPSAQQVRSGGVNLGGRRGGGATKGPSMADLDADKDDKVTPTELAAYYRKNGLAPFQVHFAGEQASPLGGLALLGRATEPSVEAVSAAIFALLDANGDGKLTKGELALAPAALLRMDENEDEIVTARELVPNAKSRGGLFGAAMMMGGGKKAASGKAKALLVLPAPGVAPPGLDKALLERYAPKTKRPGEKALTRQELGLDEATFRKLDVNGDGVLDGVELAGFAKRGPDLEVVVRLGAEEREGSVELVRPKGRPSLADKVTRAGGVALLDLGMTRVELRSDAAKEGGNLFGGLVRQQLLAQFKAADKDGNGYLDKKEAEASRTYRNLFKTMDRDGDGQLYEKEVVAFLDQYERFQARAKASCASLEMADASRGLFDLLDANRDGRLSVREMRGAVGLLKRLDRGGKGYLTKADVPRTYRLTLQPGPGGDVGQAGAFAALYGGRGGSEREAPGVGPAWFRKMDRNRDGDVSRKEWLFSEEKFRQIDTDGDGLISVEEAERYEALLRKGP